MFAFLFWNQNLNRQIESNHVNGVNSFFQCLPLSISLLFTHTFVIPSENTLPWCYYINRLITLNQSPRRQNCLCAFIVSLLTNQLKSWHINSILQLIRAITRTHLQLFLCCYCYCRRHLCCHHCRRHTSVIMTNNKNYK